MGESGEERALEKPAGESPIARFRVKLEDTPENRKRVAEASKRLASAITAGGKNIAFGVGLRNGGIVLEADDLDLIPEELREKK